MLLSIALAAAAANAVSGSAPAPPRTWHGLEYLVRELTEAIILKDSRAVFRAFAPTFQQEIGFARFDSALRRWHSGRRVTIGRGEVVDTRGISGRASSWVVFEGEADYEYVYQSWVFAGDTWRLVWLSNILDRSFDYGNRDSLDVRAMQTATLDWLLDGGGLRGIPPGYPRPDTVLIVDSTGAADWLPDYPTVVCTPARLRTRDGLPNVPFAFRFALTRSYGPVGTCAVDILPLRRLLGLPGRHRNVQVHLARVGGRWRYLGTGPVW